MIADSLLLDMERTRHLGKLEIGYAMVKLQGRWFDPFLVKFPLVKVDKGCITDDMIKERMVGFYKDELGIVVEEIMKGGNLNGFEAKTPESEKKAGKEIPEEEITKGQELLLLDILNDGFSSTSERYHRLGFNDYQGNKIKKSLSDNGLIEVKDFTTKTGRVKLLLITEKGKQTIKKIGHEVNPSYRKGGIEHEYWKKKVAEHFREEGYRVIEEYSIGEGKSIDLVAIKDDEKIAIEIETGKSDAIYNISKDLDAGFNKVFCVTLKEDIKTRIKRQMEMIKLDNKKIKILTAEGFF